MSRLPTSMTTGSYGSYGGVKRFGSMSVTNKATLRVRQILTATLQTTPTTNTGSRLGFGTRITGLIGWSGMSVDSSLRNNCRMVGLSVIAMTMLDDKLRVRMSMAR